MLKAIKLEILRFNILRKNLHPGQDLNPGFQLYALVLYYLSYPVKCASIGCSDYVHSSGDIDIERDLWLAEVRTRVALVVEHQSVKLETWDE